MKPKKRIIALVLIAATVILAFSSCKKDGSAIQIEGFQMTDAAGNDIGHYGPVDDDWLFRTSPFSAREMALLDFSDGATLDGTAEGTISTKLKAFPNPAIYAQDFIVTSSETIVFKLVIVNKNLKVLRKTESKFKGALSAQLDLADPSLFADGGSYRAYFSVSAEGKPNFKVGYGDIKKCSADAQTVEDCF